MTVPKPVAEWFNASAPRVKSGEIDIRELTEEAALALMMIDPLLIRRPLMEVRDRREAGFDQARVDAWIGLRPGERPVSDVCIKHQNGAAMDTGMVEPAGCQAGEG